METLTVEQVIQHIQKLPDVEKSQLAKQVLPMLLSAEGIFTYLEKFFDSELDAIVEQVRERNQHLEEEEVACVISEALQEIRASNRV